MLFLSLAVFCSHPELLLFLLLFFFGCYFFQVFTFYLFKFKKKKGGRGEGIFCFPLQCCGLCELMGRGTARQHRASLSPSLVLTAWQCPGTACSCSSLAGAGLTRAVFTERCCFLLCWMGLLEPSPASIPTSYRGFGCIFLLIQLGELWMCYVVSSASV